MAPTPYPRNLMHVGSAGPLTLASPLTVPPSGDITLTVEGDISTKGWLSIPSGEKMVITVGRGTVYESKYLVSSIAFGTSTSTLTTLAVDRNFDGTAPKNAPVGTAVEHTISAEEMSSANDHTRTKQAHGSDGELVDQNSTQALSNKTFPTPTASGHPATKGYVDAAAAASLQKTGGTMTGSVTFGGDDDDRGARFLDNAGVLRYWIAYSSDDGRLSFHQYTSGGAYQGLPISIDTSGQVKLNGNLVIRKANGYSQTTFSNAAAAYWIGTDPGASDALTIAVLNKDTLTYVSTALSVSKLGHVYSRSHIGGRWVGSTDGLGNVTVALPAAPDGKTWAFTFSHTSVFDITRGVATASIATISGTSATLSFAYGNGYAASSKAVTVHWHAVAY